MDQLTKHDKRASMMGKTGVDKAQTYGASAVGADEKDIKKQKQNMAISFGRGTRKGASATMAIQWTWGTEGQPEVRAHMAHIEAWLRYLDNYMVGKKELIDRAWNKVKDRIEGARRKGMKEITEMRSA